MPNDADVLPGTHDITLYRGDTFAIQLAFTQGGIPLELPGTGWLAQVRSPNGSGPVTGTLTVDASNAGDGIILVTATAAEVAVLRAGAWDLQCTVAPAVRTYIRGALKIERDVSRA